MSKKSSKPRNFKVPDTSNLCLNLTKVQREVYHFLIYEYLTPKQIAIRRGTTVRAVNKVIKKLKDKGVINRANMDVLKTLPSQEPFNTKHKIIRLHGQEFNIRILYQDERYEKIQGNVLTVDGNTVRLYRNSIEVYGKKSFYADTVHKATVRSFEYWSRFFVSLENQLNVIFLKPRSHNIKLVNVGHYVEVNNELARKVNVDGDKIRVYTTDDGKLWFTIDKSFTHEAECLHPQTSKRDMEEVVVPFFNDLRDNPDMPSLSEVWTIISEMAIQNKETSAQNKETAAGLSSIVTIMKSELLKQESRKRDKTPHYIG